MRSCDGCTLCCTIAAVEQISKPSNCKCSFSVDGVGCGVYWRRPKVCSDFSCLWQVCDDMPEDMSPKKTHMYVSGNLSDEVIKVRVDPDHADAWKNSDVVQWLQAKGKHVLVTVGDQINFLQGDGQARPQKILIDWTL